MFKVFALIKNQQVKVPRSTKVGNDDCINRHWPRNFMPRRRRYGWHLKFDRFAKWFFDVFQFLYADGWMVPRLLKRKPEPEAIPDKAHDTVKVESSLPTYPTGKNSRHWHSNNDPGIRATESHRRQTRSLKWRCPKAPYTMARWIRHAL